MLFHIISILKPSCFLAIFIAHKVIFFSHQIFNVTRLVHPLRYPHLGLQHSHPTST